MKSIGIIGGGFVGQILHRYYPESRVFDVLDALKTHSLGDVLAQDIVFIAVNFGDNARGDSYTLLASQLAVAPRGRVFVIKSTFVPGTTDRLQKEFPQHSFVYNPEFLTEMTAWEDFTNPWAQILGLPHQSLPLWKELFDLLPDAPVKRVVSPLDAEMLKHAKNSFYALKVIYFNEMYDACQRLGADYETVREVLVQDPWIGDSHSKIFHKGYRGFGGKCLPKDAHALAVVSESELLVKIIEINDKLRAQQKV